MNEYDILLEATIEIGGKFKANTRDEAVEAAKLELRSHGEVLNVEVRQAIYLHNEDPYGLDAA